MKPISDSVVAHAGVCPFYRLAPEQVWLENEHALAFRDIYPVIEGHTLVVPRSHYSGVFDASPREQVGALKSRCG